MRFAIIRKENAKPGQLYHDSYLNYEDALGAVRLANQGKGYLANHPDVTGTIGSYTAQWVIIPASPEPEPEPELFLVMSSIRPVKEKWARESAAAASSANPGIVYHVVRIVASVTTVKPAPVTAWTEVK